jgi:glycosyltransferase involved in cell wall biosynthesis
MKKVLFVFSHPAPYKVNLFNALAKSVDLTVIFERMHTSYSKLQYQNNPAFLFRYHFLKGFGIGKENHLSLGLIDHIKRHHYDVIIINGYSSWTEMLTIRYLIRHKIPYVLAVNGGVIRHDFFLKRWLKKVLISHARYYLSPSPKVDGYLIHYGARKKDIFYYPYGTIFASDVIKKILTKKEKLTLRLRYQLPQGKLFVSVGQFIPRKNFLALLNLWRTMPSDHHLVIIGDGPLLHRYEDFIHRYYLNNVIIKPFLPKPALFDILKAADVFVLLSKEDIYGHVINEALSQGLPVVASDVIISAKTLIREGVHGYLVPLKDSQKQKQALLKALTLKTQTTCIDVAKESTIETMTEAYQKFIETSGSKS